VDLESGRIIGVEALVRWRHPARGVLSPAVFIPAAERAGLIASLGKWVLVAARHQARCWLDDGITPDRLGVNFSSLQLKIPGQLEKEIDVVLRETGLPTNMLELELTETTIMETTQDHAEFWKTSRSGALGSPSTISEPAIRP
jgi:EAL domain-containing protein (putative c-di-GMP-specific phosphodiesterase class I)